MTKPLRPYQAEGVRFLVERGRAFLGDEPGLGKSRQLIEAASGRTLVVAPAMVLDGGTWDDQISEWAADDADIHQVAYSGLNLRQPSGRKSKTGADIYELTTGVAKSIKDLGRIETLILDESHYVKGRSTYWTYAVHEIARTADQVFLATGTPIPNWPHELFVPLQLLYPAEAKPSRKFGSYWRWVEQWFYVEPSQWAAHKKDITGMRGCVPACQLRPPTDPCEHYRIFVEENLGDRFLQRLRDTVLTDLPPLTRQTIKVEMTAKQARAYREMKKQFVTMVDDREVVAWSAGAKNVMLDRITTGLGILDGSPDRLAESNKMDRLAFDLESRSRPTLVVAHYRNSVEAAAQVARGLGASVAIIHGGTTGPQRLAAVQDFQAGKIDVLCGSLETVAEGLTLTAADQIIRIERSYKPSRNQQAERRIHRMGQTRPCSVLDYESVLPGGRPTLDGNKTALLERKTDTQVRVLTAAQFKTLL